jgi:hypothetical protein
MKLFLHLMMLTAIGVGGLGLGGCEREDTATPNISTVPNPAAPPVDMATPRTATEQLTPPTETALPSTLPSTAPSPM